MTLYLLIFFYIKVKVDIKDIIINYFFMITLNYGSIFSDCRFRVRFGSNWDLTLNRICGPVQDFINTVL